MLIALVLLAPPEIPRFDPIELVARYRAYRLPEPPLDAKPVVCTDISTVQSMAFAVPSKPSVIYELWKARAINAVDDERILGPMAGVSLRDIRADEDLWPSVAILESRGDGQDAERLLRAVFANRTFFDPRYLEPWRPMHKRAWAYWRAQALERPAERVSLLTWLKSWPKIDGLEPSKAEKSFIEDLQASAGPAPAYPNPNRFDRLMEQTLTAKGLALSDQKYGPWSGYGFDDGNPAGDSNADIAKPVRELWEAGFDAIPTMFRYLDDRRITTLGADGTGAITGRAYHRMCDVAADDIVTALEGQPDFYSRPIREWDDPGPDDAYPPDDQISRVKASWPAWLALKNRGERNVLLGRMKEMDQYEHGALDTVSTDGLRAYPLWVLAIKYRSTLVNFCRHAKFRHERIQIEAVLYETKRSVK